MSDISILTTNTYRVLAFMFEKKDKNNIVNITQNEIASHLDLNKSSVNIMIKSLKEKGYITVDEQHLGRYSISDKAVKTVALFKKTEKIN